MAKILKIEVQAAHPNAEVIDGVKIYEKLPEATIEEWKTKHPGQKIDGLTRRDDGLYMQRGELDMMVAERDPAGAKGKIARARRSKQGLATPMPTPSRSSRVRAIYSRTAPAA